MASGPSSREGLPAFQVAPPARGDGLQMDGRAMPQQAAPWEGEKRRERWGRGRALPQFTGTGVTVLLPQGQGGGAQGSRTLHCVFSHKMIKTTEGFISFPVTVDATAVTIMYFFPKVRISL